MKFPTTLWHFIFVKKLEQRYFQLLAQKGRGEIPCHDHSFFGSQYWLHYTLASQCIVCRPMYNHAAAWLGNLEIQNLRTHLKPTKSTGSPRGFIDSVKFEKFSFRLHQHLIESPHSPRSWVIMQWEPITSPSMDVTKMQVNARNISLYLMQI